MKPIASLKINKSAVLSGRRPLGKGVGVVTLSFLARCGHVFGLLVRDAGPLALMGSA